MLRNSLVEADSVCGERRQVRKCYWAEMVRVAGEDRPDLSCHSPDAPCSLVPGLDYPCILGMESRTWRITDRIVEDYNRYLWCFTGWRHEYWLLRLCYNVCDSLQCDSDNVEAATEEVMSWQWRWAGPPTMGGSHAGTSPELWAEDGRISQRKEQLHRDRNCMKPLVKYTKLYWDWRSVSKCWTIWVPSIILPTIFQQERKTLPGKT